LNDISDDLALSMAKNGDKDAFGILYERYVGRIYNYIYYRTGNPKEAEDLTARVFYRAINHIGTYKNLGVPFSAWLYRIAHNLVANWHRDSSRRKEVPLEDHIELRSRLDIPETALEISQEKERLLKAIRNLPVDRQEVILLKFLDRMSNAEIASVTGRSEGAIKSLYHRTLLTLRDNLEIP
jgi:RNA polymerase sigma-70 factor, ECF subfamily